MYPEINKQIAGATIQEIEGKIHVTVASMRIKKNANKTLERSAGNEAWP